MSKKLWSFTTLQVKFAYNFWPSQNIWNLCICHLINYVPVYFILNESLAAIPKKISQTYFSSRFCTKDCACYVKSKLIYSPFTFLKFFQLKSRWILEKILVCLQNSYYSSLSTQSCNKRLLVVRDLCFWQFGQPGFYDGISKKQSCLHEFWFCIALPR